MLIANPIYDVVFKYLLDDTEIARDLLSVILGVNIVDLQVKPQETLVQGDGGEIKIFHLDFRAQVEDADGRHRTVLIELQKAKKSYDLMRFRKYLGENYTREEVRHNDQGEVERYVAEIVTIYFLGFKLSGVEVPVLKVSRRYEDAITHEEVSAVHPFIQKLTHESYTIQIPRLRRDHRSQLEEVLAVFIQANITDDLHTLRYESAAVSPLTGKVLRRLERAAASADIRRGMDAEDAMDRILNRELRALSEQLQAKDEQLQAKDEQLQAKEEQLQSKEEQLQAQDEQLQAAARERAELQRQLEEALKRLRDA